MNVHVTPAPVSVGAGTVGIDASRDDRELLRRCRRAMVLLKREEEIENRYVAAVDRFEEQDPPRPLVPVQDNPIAADRCEHLSSSAMRKELALCRGGWHAERIARYRERIARVVAWEKEHAALDREIGMSRVDAAQTRALAAVRAAIEPIVDLRPLTVDGLVAKASLVTTACDRRFTSVDEPFGRLAWAVAADVIAVAALRKSH